MSQVWQPISFRNSKGTISASQINRFRRCPLSYYFSKISQEQIEVDMKYADLGTLIHDCNKQYFDIMKMYEQTNPTDEEIKTKYTEMSMNYMQFDKSLKGRFSRCVENFIKFEQNRAKTWERYLPDSTEEVLTVGNIMGIVDLIQDPIILDWKTGSSMTISEEMIIQGKTYEYLAKNSGYNVEKVLFVMLGNGKVHTIKADMKVNIRLLNGGKVSGIFKEDDWFHDLIQDIKIVISEQNYFRDMTKCKYCNYSLKCNLGKSFTELREMWW